MIETNLMQYGPLGIMVAIMLMLYLKQQKREDALTNKLIEVINNNTIALTRFYEVSKIRRGK